MKESRNRDTERKIQSKGVHFEWRV